MAKINIKGTIYEVIRDDLNNPDLAGADGLCRVYSKEIIVKKKSSWTAILIIGKSTL